MKQLQNITLVGSGNVARALHRAIKSSTMVVRYYRARNPAYLRELKSSNPQASFDTDLSLDKITNSLIILAISDQAIRQVSNQIKPHQSNIIVHCSGNTTINTLSPHYYHGVIWPLQTIQGSKTSNFRDIPMIMDANMEEAYQCCSSFCQALGGIPYRYNDTQRQNIHLSAVLANNFVTFFVKQAHEHLGQKEIDTTVLAPIIKETMNRFLSTPPNFHQTGPAVRGDHNTLSIHENLIEDATFRNIYHQISSYIYTKYNMST